MSGTAREPGGYPAHHPNPETLLGYAAGELDEAFRVVIATHLGGCAQCRAEVLRAERIGGGVLDGMAEAAMRGDALARCMARLDAPAPVVAPRSPVHSGLPTTLAGYAVGRWRPIGRGIALVTVLPAVGGRAGLHLLRIAPGVRLAGHGHGGLELTAVLRGQVRDTVGTYGVGDVAENSEDVDHAPMAVGDQTCVCMIAVGGKLVFRNWLLRLMQPLFGM